MGSIKVVHIDLTELTIEGYFVPKARPRFSGTHAYLPKNYRDSKAELIRQFTPQWKFPPCETCEVLVYLHGYLSGDADNLIGSLLDAMKEAGVIVDDTIKHVPLIICQHVLDTWTGAKVFINPVKFQVSNDSAIASKKKIPKNTLVLEEDLPL